MKLNKTMKDTIRRKALKSAFGTKIEIAKKAVSIRATNEIKKTRPSALEVPEKLESYVRTTTSAHLSDMYDYRPHNYIILNEAFCGGSVYFDYKVHQEWDEVKALMAICNLEKSASKDIKAVLASCNTEKQLMEVSPELYAFMPEKSLTSGLPVAVESVNRIKAIFGDAL